MSILLHLLRDSANDRRALQLWPGTTLSLSAAAYVANCLQGTQPIDKGTDAEASRDGALYGKTMQKIILPSAIKLMIPSFINQFVITLKEYLVHCRVIELGRIDSNREHHYRPYLPIWLYV